MRPVEELQALLESDDLYEKACIASTANTLHHILASEPVVRDLSSLVRADPSNIPRLLTYTRRLLYRDRPTRFRFYNDVAVSCVLIALSSIDDSAYWGVLTALSREDDALLGWIPSVARFLLGRREVNAVLKAMWNEARGVPQFQSRPSVSAQVMSPYVAHSFAMA